MITNKCVVCESITNNKFCSNKCRSKDYRNRHPDRVTETKKKHYIKNKDIILERDKNRYWNGGKEKANQQSKNWYNKNKEYRKEYTEEYRSKQKDLFNHYKDLERFGGNKIKVLQRDNYKCMVCKNVASQKHKLNVHHIDGSGGNNFEGYIGVNNNMDNLITLCSACHARVHGYQNRTFTYFTSYLLKAIAVTSQTVMTRSHAVLPLRNS